MGRIFNGSSDKIDCGAFADNQATMSVTCWFKTTSAASQILVAKLSAGGIATGNGWAMYLSAGKPAGLIQGSAGTAFSNPVGASTVNDGNWHSLTMDWDGAGNKLYLDGVGNSNDGIHGTLTSYSNAVNVLIGTDAASEFFFNGSIAEVGVWAPRVQRQFAQFMNGVLPYEVTVGTLLAYFPLWGFSSPEVDLSGNTRSGTLTGTTATGNPPNKLFTPAARTPPDTAIVAATSQVGIINEVRYGPPLPGAPWLAGRPFVAEAGSLVIAPPRTSPPVMPEIRTGPPIPGAPWFTRPFVAEAAGLMATPPAAHPPLAPVDYEIHAGPPMPGAPWFRLMPDETTRLLRGPIRQPQPTPVPGPGKGTAKPFIERWPDVSDPRRLGRITDKVSSLLNSLIGQAALQQIGPAQWAIRQAAIVQARPPTSADDVTVGAVVGGAWIDTAARKMWFCASNAQGAAVWIGPLG